MVAEWVCKGMWKGQTENGEEQQVLGEREGRGCGWEGGCDGLEGVDCRSHRGLVGGAMRDWWVGLSGVAPGGYSGLVGTGYRVTADWQTTTFKPESV